MQILQNRDELDYQKSINLTCKLMRGINKLMTATGDCYQQIKVTTLVLTHDILLIVSKVYSPINSDINMNAFFFRLLCEKV